MHLSTEQRILLHLSRFVGKESRWEAPYEVSQAGISASLHLPQSTISRSLKSLKEKGAVEHRVMYVRGEKRKKSIYLLTSHGLKEAENILELLLNTNIKIKVNGELKTVDIGEAVVICRERKNDMHPLEIYEKYRKNGILEIEYINKYKFIKFHVPEQNTVFVGREEIMKEIHMWLEKSKFVLVKGMAGMGKSSLLLALVPELSTRYHVFWYGIKKSRGYLDIMNEINDFLRLLGKRPVERRIGAKGLFREVKDLDVVLIFDDLHFADENTCIFLREISEYMFSEPCGLRILGTSREDLSIFRRSDVARGKLHEIILEPLKKEEIAALFPEENLDEVYSATGGIPIFIQLYRNAGLRIMDVERILDEEIFFALSEDEKLTLKNLSIHRIPVYPEALGDVDMEMLEKLMKKLLIFEPENGKIDMHDLIKEVLYRSISLEERKALHERAADYYLSQWSDEKDQFEAVHHLQMADKWERAAKLALNLASTNSLEYADPVLDFLKKIEEIPEELRGELLILIGDVLSVKGRWEEAMDIYREARGYLGDLEELRERMASANIGMENWDESLRIEEELLKDAVKRKEKHGIVRHLITIGNIYLRSGSPEKAVKSYLEAKELMKSLGSREGMAVIENNIGTAYIKLGSPESAEEHILESLRLSKERGRIGLKALSNLGYTYELKGNLRASERAYKNAMKIAKKPEDLVRILERLIPLLIKEGRWGEAIALGKRWEIKLPNNERWRILSPMADAYREGKMYEYAIKTRREAYEYSGIGNIRLEMVEDMIFAGMISESLNILEEEERKTAPWEEERLMRIYELKGRALYIMGNKEKATEYYINSIKIADKVGAEDRAVRLRKVLEKL